VRAATRPIPLSSPYVDERDEELVLEVLRSGRLSLGPAIDRFQQVFAEKVGAPFAAAVSSGTSGLHLLAAIAGLGEGDEVITSPVLVRRLGQLLHLRGCDARVRGRRRADDESRPGRGRRPRSREDEGASSPSTSSATPASSIRSASWRRSTGSC
jgi:hypothetical protein